MLLDRDGGLVVTNRANLPYEDLPNKNLRCGTSVLSDGCPRVFCFRSLYLYHYVLRNLRQFHLRFRPFDYEKARDAGISPELIEDAKQLRVNRGS